MKVLELENVTVTLEGRSILEEVTLTLESGDFLGVIGPNGAGKTVLLKTIVGAIKPDAGAVRVLGGAVEEHRGAVGYVPQFPTFKKSFPITVLEVVLMGRLVHRGAFRRYTKEDREIAAESLRQVNLYERRFDQVGKLSGGQIQRVMIARALASEPKLLLFDEPTASLDSAVGQSFYSLLDELALTKTIVLVSHDIGVISRHVKTIACLNRRLHYHHSKEIAGEVLQEVYGCPVELIAHGHAHRVLRRHQDSCEGEGGCDTSCSRGTEGGEE